MDGCSLAFSFLFNDKWICASFSCHSCYLFPLRSSLRTSAQKQKAGTGTWSTSAASSARRFWAASATSWKRAVRTAADVSSPSTPSTATPVANISVGANFGLVSRAWRLPWKRVASLQLDCERSYLICCLKWNGTHFNDRISEARSDLKSRSRRWHW